MENDNSIVKLAILNITSWAGQCSDAEHLYGNLILSTDKNVTTDNVEEYHVKYLGKNIKLDREITFEEAIKLDIKDEGDSYKRSWYRGEKTTHRFNSMDQVLQAGIEKWRELNIDCPFISLYSGEKYSKNKFSDSETIILNPKSINNG